MSVRCRRVSPLVATGMIPDKSNAFLGFKSCLLEDLNTLISEVNRDTGHHSEIQEPRWTQADSTGLLENTAKGDRCLLNCSPDLGQD